MLHRTFHHFPHPRHAQWQTCRGALCPAYPRQPLCNFRATGTPGLLRRVASFSGNVWRESRAGNALAGAAGTGHATRLDFQRGFLQTNQLADALLRQVQHGIHFITLEWLTLGGALDFDKTAAAGHDNIHIRIAARILDVIQVQHRHTLVHPHGNGGDKILEPTRLSCSWMP